MAIDFSSPFLRKHERTLKRADGYALDLPCGSGRNLAVLERFGYTVTSADIATENFLPEVTPVRSSNLPLQIDGYTYVNDFNQKFDLVAVIHPPHHAMLDVLSKYVRIGGLLVFETFGAQGKNWTLLPSAGEIERKLIDSFDLIVYDEKVCRQSPSNVTVKLIGRRLPV